MTRLKEVFAIANNKGGVGKTTTAQNVAAGLARIHHVRVLVIDLDAQGNISYLLGWDRLTAEQQHMPTVYDALRGASSLPVYASMDSEGKQREGIYYVPASKYLETVDNDLHHHMNAKMVLAKCFARPLAYQHGCNLQEMSIMEAFDYIIIDCPPAMNEVTYNALGVATGLLIPLQLEGMSIQGLADMIVTYKRVKEDLNPNIELTGLLKVMTTDRLNTAKGFCNILDQQFGDKVFKAHVRRSDQINQAQTLRKDIFEYKMWGNAGNDYRDVVNEIIERTKE